MCTLQKELEASGKSDNLKKIVGLLLTKKNPGKAGRAKGNNNTSSIDTASFESSDHPTEEMTTTAETMVKVLNLLPPSPSLQSLLNKLLFLLLTCVFMG